MWTSTIPVLAIILSLTSSTPLARLNDERQQNVDTRHLPSSVSPPPFHRRQALSPIESQPNEAIVPIPSSSPTDHEHHPAVPERVSISSITAPVCHNCVSPYSAAPTTTTSPTTSSIPNDCTATVMGHISNPCRSSALLAATAYPATVYTAQPVDCGGCSAIHVVEPVWGCPMVGSVAQVGTTVTAQTPYTFTDTVCAASATGAGALISPGDDGVPTVTVIRNVTQTVSVTVVSTSTTVEMPWFSLPSWRTMG